VGGSMVARWNRYRDQGPTTSVFRGLHLTSQNLALEIFKQEGLQPGLVRNWTGGQPHTYYPLFGQPISEQLLQHVYDDQPSSGELFQSVSTDRDLAWGVAASTEYTGKEITDQSAAYIYRLDVPVVDVFHLTDFVHQDMWYGDIRYALNGKLTTVPQDEAERFMFYSVPSGQLTSLTRAQVGENAPVIFDFDDEGSDEDT
jgi:hypothetical protein